MSYPFPCLWDKRTVFIDPRIIPYTFKCHIPFLACGINVPSLSTPEIISWTSASVGLCPNASNTCLSSFMLIVPPPSLSKSWKASLYSARKRRWKGNHLLRNDVINMPRARDKKKTWVPDRNWTQNWTYDMSFPTPVGCSNHRATKNSWRAYKYKVHVWHTSCIPLGSALSQNRHVYDKKKKKNDGKS